MGLNLPIDFFITVAGCQLSSQLILFQLHGSQLIQGRLIIRSNINIRAAQIFYFSYFPQDDDSSDPNRYSPPGAKSRLLSDQSLQ